ncbi:hypothetical protein [Gracilinema caldarium]|uniref:hypothetical protein n=1 Tax=Gracilinema caldarium TaxID=215591 RepID=UPI0002D73685|nr:hypothetical protein [Gracilinema caldarium]
MDKYIFKYIEGFAGEDYTTALLGYLHEYSNNEVLLNMFSMQDIIKKTSKSTYFVVLNKASL